MKSRLIKLVMFVVFGTVKIECCLEKLVQVGEKLVHCICLLPFIQLVLFELDACILFQFYLVLFGNVSSAEHFHVLFIFLARFELFLLFV